MSVNPDPPKYNEAAGQAPPPPANYYAPPPTQPYSGHPGYTQQPYYQPQVQPIIITQPAAAAAPQPVQQVSVVNSQQNNNNNNGSSRWFARTSVLGWVCCIIWCPVFPFNLLCLLC